MYWDYDQFLQIYNRLQKDTKLIRLIFGQAYLTNCDCKLSLVIFIRGNRAPLANQNTKNLSFSHINKLPRLENYAI